MDRFRPHTLTTLHWLQFCLLLVLAVVGHDVLMAASGQHVPQVAAEATCEREAPAGHHGSHGPGHHDALRHHGPTPAGVDHEPDESSIGCDGTRVVTTVKRALDDAGTVSVAPLHALMAPTRLAATMPFESDWLARDPHARRALWQVYRI
jgi:hypothetical protein